MSLFSKIGAIGETLSFKLRYPRVALINAPSPLYAFGFQGRSLCRALWSQEGQDEYIFLKFYKAFGSKNFPKIFVDIGCNVPRLFSNSLFFEEEMGFSVLAIDALDEMALQWAIERPSAKFICTAVGDQEGELVFGAVDEMGGYGSMFSAVEGASSKAEWLRGAEVRKRKVGVRRLENIFSEQNITSAGIVSIDIEGYELNALKGIDFHKFSAAVFVVENNSSGRFGDDAIRSLMSENDYEYVARFWALDDIFVNRKLLEEMAMRS